MNPALPDAGPLSADAAPPFGAEVVSLRLKRSIAVRLTPEDAAKSLGTIAQDTYVTWQQVAASSDGCDRRWVEIQPRGWICERYLEPSSKPPGGVELPRLKPGEIVPGTYGKLVRAVPSYATEADVRMGKRGRILAGAVKVRKLEDVVVAGRRFWRTTGGLVPASAISMLTPSTFEGVSGFTYGIGLPLAWALSRHQPKQKIAVRGTLTGRPTRFLVPRTLVPVLEASEDGQLIRIGDDEWVAADDLRVARLSEAPPTTGPNERWMDVDLDEQVVVAYDGSRPVYATLVSSGSSKWPTQAGTYRIWIKFAETDMSGQMGDEAPYSVATVPWTMFFAKDLAFHTAYWHDRFGEPRSHGCINLSPRDARALYFWASPDVPPGWSMVHGIMERPGSLVRIRNSAVPNPEFFGYAKRIYEERMK